MRKVLCVLLMAAMMFIAVPEAGAMVGTPAPQPPTSGGTQFGILCYSFFPAGAMCFVFPAPTGTFYR